MATIRELMQTKRVSYADPLVEVCAQGIHAGGPGSGCHGENCGRHESSLGHKGFESHLQKHGYSDRGIHRIGGRDQATFKHRSGNTVHVDEEGDWRHYNYDKGGVKKGSGAKSLGEHLDNTHPATAKAKEEEKEGVRRADIVKVQQERYARRPAMR